MKAKRARGERAGNLPYGCQLNADRRTRDLNVDERHVLRLLHDLNGGGLAPDGRFGAELNRQGCATRRGTTQRHQYRRLAALPRLSYDGTVT